MHIVQWPRLRLQATRMDESLTFFTDAVGACERILRTPIPLSYTRCAPRPPSLLMRASAQPSRSACRALVPFDRPSVARQRATLDRPTR